MNQTPNLGLPHIYANQSQKEVTANQCADGLDTAIAGCIVIDLNKKTEYTLNAIETRHAILIFEGVLTAPVTITIPTESANRKFIMAHHGSGEFPLYVQHANTPPVTLQSNERRWVFSDREQLYLI